ncbi:MAG: twin-arginine translocation signal domain-containing protein, partial [Planctomycetia bacterium]|nr:twin-arginine translocation signal domain-containing protein [Planctomycetia bacterium]
MITSGSRRRFLGASAATGSLLLLGTRASRAIAGSSDRVRIAVIGLNGRGKAHLAGFGAIPGVEIATVVDPDQKVLDRTLADLAKKAGDAPLATKGEKDF